MKKEPLLIAFASQKGGVGKSAFTVLVASILHYQKGLKVGVVDCDSPQHSISRMRDRDIESVQESDFLKVALYRQHEQIRKRSYPVIKSNPEKAIEDLYRHGIGGLESGSRVSFTRGGLDEVRTGIHG